MPVQIRLRSYVAGLLARNLQRSWRFAKECRHIVGKTARSARRAAGRLGAAPALPFGALTLAATLAGRLLPLRTLVAVIADLAPFTARLPRLLSLLTRLLPRLFSLLPRLALVAPRPWLAILPRLPRFALLAATFARLAMFTCLDWFARLGVGSRRVALTRRARGAAVAAGTVPATITIGLTCLDSALRGQFDGRRRKFFGARLVEQWRADLGTLGAQMPQTLAALWPARPLVPWRTITALGFAFGARWTCAPICTSFSAALTAALLMGVRHSGLRSRAARCPRIAAATTA